MQQETNNDTNDTPKTQSYANALYELMDNNAVKRVVAGQSYKVWEGPLTKTMQSIGVPQGVERRVTRLLEELDCIQILQRGSRTYPSVVALLAPPTADRWDDFRSRGLTTRPTAARLAAEVKDIKKMLGGGDIAAILINFEERIVGIESVLRKNGLM